MNNFGIIYKATNKIDGKVYIGQTVEGLLKRRRGHEKLNHTYYFSRAIRKYGKDKFKWEVIEYCDSKEEMDEMEFHYIMQYNSFGKNGYNLTYGGEGSPGRKLSIETKRKIGKKATGRWVSPETRKKLSDANMGKTLSFEARRKQLMNIPRGEQHQFFGMFGKNNPTSLKYIITDTNGKEFVVTGIQYFCKKYKHGFLNASHLVKCAKNKRKSHKGYKCRHYDENVDGNLPLWEITNAQ